MHGAAKKLTGPMRTRRYGLLNDVAGPSSPSLLLHAILLILSAKLGEAIKLGAATRGPALRVI
jgi:hypothetical protein